ncbi:MULTISPECIES: Tim44 domain-containing protein [Comamonas]|uniref:Tim44 domain-containing protein n=1 Tax=Comamonas avium TaxID=2762231 RepID=A0ABR8SDX2_9BURK|nr:MULTISPECIES: Tim44-like domain-containing protein [Comamonas]MBD7961690.1 Tim44 domain-containing protein [Comamonas avium]MBD9401310.1 Tim44 domain-containing protein [Comamonas sp. CMM02]
MKKVWAVTLAAALVVIHPLAEAKRMGGGGSFGKQSSNVTQRQATPPAAPPARPAQQQNAQQNNAAAKPAAPAAAAPKKPWGAMLGGLAAGLGLAWLANSLGLGEAFANMLMFGLLAMVVMVVIGAILRARANKKPAASHAAPSPFAFQGAGAPVAPEAIATPPQYKPQNVGNDASARPWEQIPGAQGSMIGSGVAAAASTWDVPADFDANGFLDAAKRNFVTLQAAWDKSDISTLRSMMTDDMLAEIQSQLEERESQSSGEPNQTDVVMIDAQLLGIEDVGGSYMASVEFSGLIREDVSSGPSPFREVWNMAKPKNNSSGWLVAGLQALG